MDSSLTLFVISIAVAFVVVVVVSVVITYMSSRKRAEANAMLNRWARGEMSQKEVSEIRSQVRQREIARGDLSGVKTDIAQTGQEKVICPNCGAKGSVTRVVKQVSEGVDPKKASAAIVTGGLSVLATGLDKKGYATESHCSNCGSTW